MKEKKFFFISVIMNCHNGEKYLTESIKSVISQTYKNWELIFCDNLSKDQSKKIVLRFKDKRIKYYKTSRFMKLYQARNYAIQKSKGNFIAFLDVDDFWTKDKLEKQINLFKKNKNYAVIYSNFYILRNKKLKEIYSNKSLDSGNITQSLLNNYRINISTTLVKRVLFKRKLFNKNYNIIGDFDYFLKLSLTNQIGCVREKLAYYRIHGKNTSFVKRGLYIKELEDWMKNNINRGTTFKRYSMTNIFLFKQVLKIKHFLANKERLSAFREIIRAPYSLKKMLILPLIFLPHKIIIKITND